jgi:arylsulfatase A-like enzyme
VDNLPQRERDDAGNTKLALEALAARPKDKPFMMWIHYFGPHDPSTSHEEVPSYGSSVADKYDHEIRFADHAIAPLLEKLEAIGKERPLAVFISADHGELLLENRRLHGSGLHETSTRIPMIVKLPGVAPGRSDALVSLVDIPVTILRMAGARGGAAMDGLDMRDILEGRYPKPRLLHSDTWRFKENGEPWYDITSVYDGEYKLLFYRHLNQMRLKRQDDLGSPPANLIDTMRVPKHLNKAMEAYMEHTGGPPSMHD